MLTPISILLIVIAAAYVAHSLPYWYTNNRGVTSPKELMELQDSFRRTIMQAIGGVIAVIALWYTAKRVRVAEKAHENEVQVRITDSYTKAIEQLGAVKTVEGRPVPNIEVRLGAIYALERIAKDSPRDHWPIMEVLTAYVRYNSPAPPANISEYELKEKIKKGVSTEVQAILTVLGRRETENNREKEGQNLNLSNCALYQADMTGANFRNANFHLSHLKRARLEETHLEGAWLYQAHLEEAQLNHAHLEGARLSLAHLEGAWLYHAHLEEAWLEQAHLEGAKLTDAHFTHSQFRTVKQFSNTPTWRGTTFDPEFRAQLEAECGKNADGAVAKPVGEASAQASEGEAQEPPSNDVEG